MKFIVDEMPDFGYDCPFFSLGWCHEKISHADTGISMCPLFNDYGHRKIGTTDDMCICLKICEKEKRDKEN